MKAHFLIDAIVRQTTVLIAQLATAGGVRAPLAHVANQVFLDLANELEAQGVSRKVGADMFGMALRAYTRKVRRLTQCATDQNRSLWEAVYDFVCQREFATREQIIARFSRDDEALVRGVLHDLTESGLIFAAGTPTATIFRATTDEELGRIEQLSAGGAEELLWVIIYREGPIARPALTKLARAKAAAVDAALANLVASGRVSLEGELYTARNFIVKMGAEHGWEAAVLDHFHALVRTICQKLGMSAEANASDEVGGSTYTFAVWQGHPMREEVRTSLTRFRAAWRDLRSRVSEYNMQHGVPANYEQIIVYGGQCVSNEEFNEQEDIAI